MKQNQYNYTRKVGRITYSIVVREAEEAKERVDMAKRRIQPTLGACTVKVNIRSTCSVT